MRELVVLVASRQRLGFTVVVVGDAQNDDASTKQRRWLQHGPGLLVHGAVSVILCLVLTSCYAPDVADCQFTCGSGCPDGTTCDEAGFFCRVPGATGSCGSPTNDASIASCETAPPGCAMRFSIDADECAVLCADEVGGVERPWPEARNGCVNAGWELVVLDTPARLMAVPPRGERVWIGAHRANTTAPWMWVDGTALDDTSLWKDNIIPGSGSGGDCAFLEGGVLSNFGRDCPSTEDYICMYPP